MSLLTGLDDVLRRLELVEQRPSHGAPQAVDTSDESRDETDVNEPQRRVRSKWTYSMRKLWAASDVGRFFVTEPTDVATKSTHFYGRVCRKDVSVITLGHHEILRHF